MREVRCGTDERFAAAVAPFARPLPDGLLPGGEPIVVPSPLTEVPVEVVHSHHAHLAWQAVVEFPGYLFGNLPNDVVNGWIATRHG